MRVRSLPAALAAGATTVCLALAGVLGTAPVQAEPVGGNAVGVSPLAATPEQMLQTNNTVYALEHVDGVLFLGGTFTEVRPAGAAPGTQTVPQARLAAMDTATGELIASWRPSVTGGGIFSMSVSPDRTRLYVGGAFNSVNGSFRGRVASFDITNPRSPVLLGTGQSPGNVNGKVTAMDSTDQALYVGGYFTQAKGQPRGKVAAFARNGDLLPWQVSLTGSNQYYPQPFVTALQATQTGRVGIGGMFDTVNGVTQHALGLVDGTTGASVPGFVPPVIRAFSYVVAMRFSDGRLFYSGRDDKTGSTARLEGVSAIDASTGRQLWGDDSHRCLGDTFALIVLHGQVWDGTHAHDCSRIGTYPEASPRFYGSVLGQDVATGEQVHFYPSVTGSNAQAGSYNNVRAFATDGDRLFVAGGFLRVNGVPQQNLTAYHVRSEGGLTPNRVARPTASPAASGARVSWTASSDVDDRFLTYRIFRGASNTPVGEVTASSTFWSRPVLTFHDSTAPAGASLAYRVQVSDGFSSADKSVLSNSVTAGQVPASYAEAVLADDPAFYWRFEETGGSLVDDSGPQGDDGTLTGGNQDVAGAEGSGVALSGDQHAFESATRSNPLPYSMELWFRSTSGSGGKLMGFGNATTGTSSQYDRHVYMTNSGRLVFGAYTGSAQTVSSTASYNDGSWHHVVATHGSGGMTLYVDGVQVAQNGVGSAESYTGRFRVGGDNLNSWPDQPSARGLDAVVDEAALYTRVLPEAAVLAHHEAR